MPHLTVIRRCSIIWELIYKNGYGGVSKNYGKAAEWFFKAARQGYSESKVELAQIYFRNPLAVKDISIAERLMTEAAEEGNTACPGIFGALLF